MSVAQLGLAGLVYGAFDHRPTLAGKLVVERALALVAVVVLSPLLVLIAVAIRLEDGGPILFRQPRFGQDGHVFDVLKFRTMRVAACDPTGALQTADRDPRVTRVGHALRITSLDELPQLLNVLAGTMSLIGPRAHPCGMQVEGRLCEDVDWRYHQRHGVRPGITGWAQVHGSRGAVKDADALHRRVSLDLDYIHRWSPSLDVMILLRTVGVVLTRENAR